MSAAEIARIVLGAIDAAGEEETMIEELPNCEFCHLKKATAAYVHLWLTDIKSLCPTCAQEHQRAGYHHFGPPGKELLPAYRKVFNAQHFRFAAEILFGMADRLEQGDGWLLEAVIPPSEITLYVGQHRTVVPEPLRVAGALLRAQTATVNACFACEAAMKSMLSYEGVSEKELRKLSHKLDDLFQQIIAYGYADDVRRTWRVHVDSMSPHKAPQTSIDEVLNDYHRAFMSLRYPEEIEGGFSDLIEGADPLRAHGLCSAMVALIEVARKTVFPDRGEIPPSAGTENIAVEKIDVANIESDDLGTVKIGVYQNLKEGFDVHVGKIQEKEAALRFFDELKSRLGAKPTPQNGEPSP